MKVHGVKIVWGNAHVEVWHMWRTLGPRQTWRVFYWLWRTRKILWIAAEDEQVMTAYKKFIALLVASEDMR